MTPYDDSLTRALEHPANDLRNIVADLYPEIYNPYSGRIKAVWRGGDGNNVSIGARTLHDYVTGETYNAWSFLLEVAGYSKAEAAIYLRQRAGLSNDGIQCPTARRTMNPKALKTEEERRQAYLKEKLENAHQLQRTGATSGSSAYFKHKGIAGVFETHDVADVQLGGKAVPGMVYGSDKYGPFVQFALRTLDGKVTGYQRIYDGKVLPGERDKDFIGVAKGSFVLFQPKGVALPRDGAGLAKLLDKGFEFGTCEGIADGGSITLARPRTFVLCALSAGNLTNVLGALRARYGITRRLGNRRKALELCVWGDHDASGTGQKAAHRAALEHHAYVRLPRIKGDFNDLHLNKGLEAVRHTRKVTPNAKWAFADDLAKQNLSPTKYLPSFDLPEPGEALIVRAPQESGKTHRLSEAVAPHYDKRIVVVTHRRSLAANLAARIRGEIYSDYSARLLDAIKLLVITYDSLYKLLHNSKLFKYDVLVLDESEQVLEHTTGRHIKHKAENEAVFEQLLRDTPRIVCLDANAGPLTVNELRRTNPTRQIRYLNHEYHVAAGRHMDLVRERDDALDALEAESRPTWYATDSLKHSRDLSAYLDDPRTLTINSETSSEGDAAAYLLDPTAEAVKHKRLIASPSVQTGVSDDSGHWEHVIGSFGGHSSTPQDATQALMRARRVDQVTVHVPHRRGQAISVKDALEGAAALDAYEAEALSEASDHNNMTNYERRRAEVEAQRTQRQASYKETYARNQALLGYDITCHLPGDLSAAQLERRQARREALKAAGLERYVNDRANAERIDADTAAKLEAAHSLTREQGFALDQYRLRDFYALPSSVNDAELRQVLEEDDYSALRQRIARYEGLIEPRAVAEARAHGEIDAGVLPSDKRGHMLRWEFAHRLSTVIGLDAETEQDADAWQEQEAERDIRVRKLVAERGGATNHRKNAIDRELANLERESSKAKTRTLPTRYGAQDVRVQGLLKWCRTHYQALRHTGILTCPLEHLASKPLEVIGDALRRCGLVQLSDCKRRRRTYAVTLASVSAMRSLSRPRRKKWDFAQQTDIQNSYHHLLRKNRRGLSQTTKVTTTEISNSSAYDLDPAAYLSYLLESGQLEAFGAQKCTVIARKLAKGDIDWLSKLARSRDLGKILGFERVDPSLLCLPDSQTAVDDF